MCSWFPQAVDMLADYGADLDIQDAKGRTALFIAAQKNDEAIVKALLGREARADIPDEYGNLPLDVSSSTRVRKCLRDYMDARQAEKFIPKLK
jgi:ankyrin repeat protein